MGGPDSDSKMTISSLRSELTAAREENQVRTAEVANLLEQQTATSAILRVIAASPTDIQPVLQVVAESAARFCDTYDAGIFLARDGTLFPKAHYGPIAFDFEPMPVARDWVCGRAFADRKTVHVNDIAVAGAEFPVSQTLAERLGHRTMLATPLMRDTEAIGALVIRRIEVKPFSEKQIKLLKIFADQAVIAIENVRLFDEVQARTRDLGEALEQQTATADVLKAISRSAFDLQPVLQTLVDSAIRLAGADMGAITLRVGDTLQFMAGGGQAAELHAYERANPHVVGRGTFQGRAALEGLTIHVADALEDPEYERPEAAIIGSFRGVLSVPLKRGQETIGVFGMARRAIGLFSPRQVELVESFADQAVIAIENVRLFDEVQARNREVTEALEQQTATAEVLKTISSSAFDLDSVLHTLVKSASDLCHSGMGYIYLRQGDVLQPTVQIGWSQEFQDHMNNLPVTPGRGSIAARVAQSGSVEQIADVLDDPEYTNIEGQRLGGFRTLLGVPLMRDGAVTGVFVLARSSVSPYSTREIELVQTFSDQAVIAIENVRLFEEVESRNRDLAESLEQQMATGAILQVIAGSPTDIQPVLDAVAESAARLCDAYDATIYLLRSDRLAVGAHHGPIPIDGTGLPVARDIVTGRAVLDRVPVHVPDLTIAGEEFATARMMAQRLGFRAILATPLLQEGKAIGALMIRRIEARPFSDSQIGLLKTFANQAVIAIGNVRLFEEVQARTADLGEALQQQTATADVLKVISRSAFDLQSVLQTLIESAVRLCGAKTSGIFMRDGDVFRLAAAYDQTPEYRAYEEANPSPISRQSWVGRTALDKAVVHIPDVTKDTEHGLPEAPRLGGYSAVLCVPLMREGSVIGVFAMTRPEPGPFTDSQIELVQTFADQAVIAIENVRLFEEVQSRTAELSESLQLQTATADVLKAISRSTFDLQSVLDTLVESAAKLCDADTSVIFKRDGDLYRWSAEYGNLPEAAAFAKSNPFAAGRDSVTGRVALEARAVHVSDVLADPDYGATQLQKLGGYRTILCVPILREGAPVGVFALTRSQVRDFTPRQIELVETFADQSGIAIENVRLFDEVQARTRELSRSLEDLRTAQDRLVQTEKLASLGQLTAGIAHEIKNPLNFVNNFSALSGELIDDLSSVLAGAPLEASVREEVAELTAMLKSNLDKVVQHGKRADSIVRNMLLHSRAGSGEHRAIDINAVVEESLNLAYHGARAEKPGFNVTLTRNFDPLAGDVDLYPQEITRVLLNLISNGFYATAKRSTAANGASYEPTLSATTRSLGDRVEIRIRDNGTGIPPEVKEKMFNPFFTTKPAGEGTGLGLSLSHDIVVKQHAGTIDVESQPGEFTEFRIVLPRAAASLAKSGGEA